MIHEEADDDKDLLKLIVLISSVVISDTYRIAMRSKSRVMTRKLAFVESWVSIYVNLE